MFDAFIGTVFIFICFMFIGLGPALFLFGKKYSFDTSLALAPVIGFLIITIIGTYLVVLNLPIASWAYILGLCCLISTCLITYNVMKKHVIKASSKSNLFYLFLGLFLVALLVLLPLLVGGEHWVVMRGNVIDNFTYMTMAGYLLNEPFWNVFHTSMQQLIDKHPGDGVAYTVLNTRYSTAVVLAWSSKILGIPIYRFEYGFETLFAIINYGIVYRLGLKLGLLARYAFLLALAVCVGFWAQVVFDIRAMGELSGIPMVAFLAFLLMDLADEDSDQQYIKFIFLGICLAGISFLYAEIIPLTFCGFVLSITIIYFLRKSYQISFVRYFSAYIGSGILAIILAIPLIISLESGTSHWFSRQFGDALNNHHNWWLAFFPFLYNQFVLIGVWGLSFLANTTTVWVKFLYIVSVILAVVYTLITICTLTSLTIFRKKVPIALIVLASFFFATILQFIVFVWRDQLWVAAKALSYGYIFTPMMLVGSVFVMSAILKNPKVKYFLVFAKILVVLWCLLQIGFGVYRVVFAASGGGMYPNYVQTWVGYQDHEYKMDVFVKFFKENRVNSIGVCITGKDHDQISEYLNHVFAFGWGMNYYDSNEIIPYSAGRSLGKQTPPTVMPLYWVVDQNCLKTIVNAKIINSNGEFVLITK